MLKVIAFGEALIDMLSTNTDSGNFAGHEAFIKFPGGAPANVAAAVAKLGGESYFAGKVGHDMFGDFLVKTLADCGVHTDYMLQTHEAKTALAFVSLDAQGERSFEFYRSPSADLFFQATDFADAWFTDAGIFHFCSNTLTHANIRQATYAGIQKAQQAGYLVSFDVNLRHNLWPEGEDTRSAVMQCLANTDVIKLCAEELHFLRGQQSETLFINELLASGPSLVLITDGGHPLKFYSATAQGELAPPKVSMVDSTAAGDAFMGGFLYSLAKANIDRREFLKLTKTPTAFSPMLNFANACGAFTVTQKGAINSLPTLSNLDALLS
ncbi:carbohydrate kinase family protein [Nitrincola alkalisediminis]|uniref:carbohydrate kinase family protein n=1 Tax=Nitrincola alkalisediminis TaxID=1366656 RepID=UPI0018741DB5|nr:carbohydrate kinase [Nitrincola alkalisediminis]